MDEISKKSTAAACSQFECDGCEIQGKLLCVHKPADLIDFFVLFMGWAIPFFSGMIIGKFWTGILVWFVLAILFFGYIEALLLCRHCPHYAEKGFWLRCHANWGLPKIPKMNPRPMNSFEKVGYLAFVCSCIFSLLYSFSCYKRTMVTLDVNYISDDRCGLDAAANSMQPLL